jgi:hypothetical protein
LVDLDIFSLIDGNDTIIIEGENFNNPNLHLNLVNPTLHYIENENCYKYKIKITFKTARNYSIYSQGSIFFDKYEDCEVYTVNTDIKEIEYKNWFSFTVN